MTLFLILSFFLITIIGVFGNENITPLLNESLINNESQTINNSQSANIFILNNTFYTNIEYTKLFRIDNLVYPKKVNITVYYNLSSNDYNIDYFYENSFTAEINKYKTSDTGYLMLEQEGNYTLCASTKISDYVSCEEITVLDSNNAECDISLNLKLDKKYYYNERFKIWNKIKDEINEKNTIYQYRRFYVRKNKKNICPTLTFNMGSGGHNVPLLKDENGIRKLTPKECFNLQGFPVDFKLPKMSDCRLCKLIGNAVSYPIIELIVKKYK